MAVGFRVAGYTGKPDLAELSTWLSEQSDKSLVLLIDEYDASLTSCLDKPVLFEEIQQILKAFWSTIRCQEGCLRFFFMTGVTKLGTSEIFPGFVNFVDISQSPAYGTLLGFTESEIRRDFAFYIEKAANQLHCDKEEILHQLRLHYNGFCFDRNASTHVYCPWSVLNFLNEPKEGFHHYWFLSGGKPNVLKKYLLNP